MREFLAALLLSVALPASAAPDTCVARILTEDDRLGRARNHAPERMPIHRAVEDYADALSGLDFRDCPPAFTQAFAAHIAAWRASLPLLRRQASRRGEMHDLFKAITADPAGADLAAYEAVIWKTWAEVERAAKPTP